MCLNSGIFSVARYNCSKAKTIIDGKDIDKNTRDTPIYIPRSNQLEHIIFCRNQVYSYKGIVLEKSDSIEKFYTYNFVCKI